MRTESDAPLITDAVLLTGTAGNGKFKATYFHGATNVTAAVTGAGYTPPDLTPGAGHDLSLVVKVKPTASVGAKRNFLVTTTSADLPLRKEAVKATVQRK